MLDTRAPVVVTIGNPNTGKSTLFNALTGLNQKVGNFPGVTVERLTGSMRRPEGGTVTLVDIPGTYSLSAHSPDEAIAVDVLLGRDPEIGQPDAVIVVADSTNLRRNLFLASQVLELGLPTIVALNMTDLAERRGITVDREQLEETLGTPVVKVSASRGEGIGELGAALDRVLGDHTHPKPLDLMHEMDAARGGLRELLDSMGERMSEVEIVRCLVDRNGTIERRLVDRHGTDLTDKLEHLRAGAGQGRDLATLEARARYGWINDTLAAAEHRAESKASASDRIDAVVNHPIVGTLIFLGLMTVVFQAVFAWATPLMDAIDNGTTALASLIDASLPPGLGTRFITEGVIAGVGSVIIFLPQILILSAFIILLEDSGYMARAAFVMDRLMRWCGLSGHSFIPMLTSFACAVPGLLGTRVIANPRDRIATIVAAPFMTCSARLPVYALLIAAFVPRRNVAFGLLNSQGLVLLGLYLLGIIGGVLTAFVLKKTLLRGPTPSFLMEMPAYRQPRLRSVLVKLWIRARVFLVRAGTLIFGVAIVVWVLSTFPRAPEPEPGASTAAPGAVQLEQSYLGRAGKAIAPVFSPLGWDWKVSAAVLASFPAREVVIAALGTIYAVESEDEQKLATALENSTHPDGRPVYTLPMALGLLVFYAFCLQCVSTMAAMRRETNSWRWPIFAWVYMTILGYGGAFACYQLGTAWSA